MYGLRPSTTGFYDNSPKGANHPSLKNRVSMPRHFAANGYLTMTAGKIYHASSLPKGDFDVIGPRPGQANKKDKPLAKSPSPTKLWDWGPQTFEEELFNDYIVSSWMIEQLEKEHEQPVFMALGLYRPHVPMFAPSRFFEDGMNTLPAVKADDRSDLPTGAFPFLDRNTPPPHSWMAANDNRHWKDAVQAYLACVHWADEQVGRVLDALEAGPNADNTIVVLFSDHGFHLGEKQTWAKWTLWERSTRVPMIITAPGMEAARCSRSTELLSIYPTVSELCGLPARGDLDGVSLVPLLKNPEKEWPHVAITSHLGDNHAVRDERWRYIRYADGSEELYDHDSDPNEWMNLADEKENAEVIGRLRALIPGECAKQVR